MSIRLSRAEIRDLTDTPVIAKQIAFLVANGIRHYIDPNHGGRPVVLRSTVELQQAASAAPAKWKPNKAA